MGKIRRPQQVTLALSGLFCTIAFLTFLMSGGMSLLGWHTTSVIAASDQKQQHQSGRAGQCTGGHHTPSFGGTVVVDINEVVCNNLTAFGGTLAINGEVKDDVITFGSTMFITGTVDGDVDLYGGTVTLHNEAHIHGAIHLYGGNIIWGTRAQVDGTVIDHTKRVDLLFTGAGSFSFPFWPILTWVALGLLLTSLLPEHVMLVRTTVGSKVRRSLVVGLLSVLMALPIVIVLVALILSIPLAIIVAIGLVVAWALGTVAIGWLIGERIVQSVAPQRNTRPLQVVVGLIVLTLAGSLPYIGWLISIGAGLLGLGAVFLSRFGTRFYGKPKHPLPL